MANHPHVQRFLSGVALLKPPPVHRFPRKDLNKVLVALMGKPFEPLATVPFKLLSYKILFLVSITSARRVSELGALSTHPRLCVFHRDKVVLLPDPSFLPKVNTIFHRVQELVLLSFCPKPTHPREKLCHSLDVRRAFWFYLERSKEFQKSEALFINFGGSRKGQKALVLY